MGWSLSDLGIAGVTLIGVVPTFIIIGLMFVFSSAFLYVTGFVSAAIYFMAGVGILWVMKVIGFFKHHVGYVLIPIVPLVMLAWGWGTDNISWMRMMSVSSMFYQEITLMPASLYSDAITFWLTPQNFGTLMSTCGFIAGIASIIMTVKPKMFKPKRK